MKRREMLKTVAACVGVLATGQIATAQEPSKKVIGWVLKWRFSNINNIDKYYYCHSFYQEDSSHVGVIKNKLVRMPAREFAEFEKRKLQEIDQELEAEIFPVYR